MLVGRRLAGMPSIGWPSTEIVPLVGWSKPAIIRSSVVLPQPDGPSSEKNSPSRMRQRGVVQRLERPVAPGDVGDLDHRPAVPVGQAMAAPVILVRRSARRRRISAIVSRMNDPTSSSVPSASTPGSLAAKRSCPQM